MRATRILNIIIFLKAKCLHRQLKHRALSVFFFFLLSVLKQRAGSDSVTRLSLSGLPVVFLEHLVCPGLRESPFNLVSNSSCVDERERDGLFGHSSPLICSPAPSVCGTFVLDSVTARGAGIVSVSSNGGIATRAASTTGSKL